MKRDILILCCGIIFALVTMIAGCSDDDKGTGTGGGGGTISARDSAIVQDLLGSGLIEVPFQVVNLSLDLLDSIPPLAKAPHGYEALETAEQYWVVTSVSSYQYSAGWHIFDFTAMLVDDVESDTVDVMGTDSVKLFANGQPIADPSSSPSPDSGYFRPHATWTIRGRSDNGDVNHNLIVWVVPSGPDTSIAARGTTDDSTSTVFDSDSLSCTIDFNRNLTLNNIMVPDNAPGQGCPTSGSVTAVTRLYVACADTAQPPNTFNINGTWTVTASPNGDGTVHISFSNGSVSWQYDDDCSIFQ